MPGAPPSAAASMPESSAIVTSPVAVAAARALAIAFCANVVPSSGGSVTLAGSAPTSQPWAPGLAASRRPNSRRLCSLCVASRSRLDPAACTLGRRRVGRLRDRALLGRAQRLDAGGGEREQVVEVRARQRRALGGGLHLHERPVAGHHDIGIHLGDRVL